MRLLLKFGFIALLFSCQAPQTQTSSESSAPEKLFGSSEEKLRTFLGRKPVVLDARKALDFSVSHPPGAVNVDWRDFSKAGSGWLLDDDFSIARRLSLWGIDPETPVLVIGNAQEGQGEEGRLAWMLKYLGVKDVQIADWKVLRSTIPRQESPVKNKIIWKPKPNDDYVATREDLKPDSIGHEGVILDVTGVAENSQIFTPPIVVKKIFWKDFITERGLPDQNARLKLDENKITKEKYVYVVSENGLTSGLVTYILREWGYRAKNFAGGYEDLRRNLK